MEWVREFSDWCDYWNCWFDLSDCVGIMQTILCNYMQMYPIQLNWCPWWNQFARQLRVIGNDIRLFLNVNSLIECERLIAIIPRSSNVLGGQSNHMRHGIDDQSEMALAAHSIADTVSNIPIHIMLRWPLHSIRAGFDVMCLIENCPLLAIYIVYTRNITLLCYDCANA